MSCVLISTINTLYNSLFFVCVEDTKTFWEWQAKSAKTTHTSVWISEDTTESRVSRLNVHTNQILAHTVSQFLLWSLLSQITTYQMLPVPYKHLEKCTVTTSSAFCSG